MTDRIDTEALQALLDKATQGDWTTPFGMSDNGWSIDTSGENTAQSVGIEGYGPLAIVAVESAWGMDEELDANARLFAQAPALAAEVLELRARAVDTIDPQCVADAIDDDKRRWLTCSGCHETEDGHDVGHYPYSPALQCKLGSGCTECGGLGAVWDTTDYEELGAYLAKTGEEEDAKEREIAELRAERDGLRSSALAIQEERDAVIKARDEALALHRKAEAELAAEKARADTLPELALSVVAYELSCAGYDDAYSYASGKYVKRMVEDQCRRTAHGDRA